MQLPDFRLLVDFGIVVLVWMVQLVVYPSFAYYKFQDTYTLGSLALIIVIWIATFLQFVPMHKTISSQPISEELLKNLVRKNRLRTLLWTMVFLWTLLEKFTVRLCFRIHDLFVQYYVSWTFLLQKVPQLIGKHPL